MELRERGDDDDDGDHDDHDDDGDQCDHVGPMWEVRLMSAGTASGRCFRVSERRRRKSPCNCSLTPFQISGIGKIQAIVGDLR